MKKSNLIIISVIGVILLCIISCCGLGAFGYYLVNESTVEDSKQVQLALCTDDLKDAYKNRTTSNFKENFTYEEFESYVSLVENKCSLLENIDFFNTTQPDIALEITDSDWDKAEYFVRTKEGKLYFLFVYEADDSLTLDNISTSSIDN